jgi:hypothetical protein
MAVAVYEKNNGTVRTVKAYGYPITRVRKEARIARVDQSLPFRIRLSNITIAGYGPSNPAPIGIQIIGFNNYIL